MTNRQSPGTHHVSLICQREIPTDPDTFHSIQIGAEPIHYQPSDGIEALPPRPSVWEGSIFVSSPNTEAALTDPRYSPPFLYEPLSAIGLRPGCGIFGHTVPALVVPSAGVFLMRDDGRD